MASRDSRDTSRDARDARWDHRAKISSKRLTSGDPVQSTWSLGRSPTFARWADDIRTQARDLIQQRNASSRSILSAGAAPRPEKMANEPAAATSAFRDILPYAVERQGSSAWSFECLFAVCSLKDILCDFSPAPTAPRSVLVRRGELTLIRLRADMEPGERIAALAHALGHVYYRHPARVCDPGAAEVANGSARREEREADLWAAHCLVQPEVYDTARAQDHHNANVAIEVAARRLAIPPWVVRLWRSAPSVEFAEAPREWLSHP